MSSRSLPPAQARVLVNGHRVTGATELKHLDRFIVASALGCGDPLGM